MISVLLGRVVHSLVSERCLCHGVCFLLWSSGGSFSFSPLTRAQAFLGKLLTGASISQVGLKEASGEELSVPMSRLTAHECRSSLVGHSGPHENIVQNFR